jgi:hypothetical protein
VSGVSAAHLLTVNCHFSLFLIKYLSKIVPNWRNTQFACVQLQRSTRSVSRLVASSPFQPIPPYVQNDSVGCISNLEKPHRLIFSLETQISLAALIQISRPQTYNNWIFKVLPTGTVYWRNHVLCNDKVSDFTRKHRVAELLPPWQLMDALPRLHFLNAITAFTLFLFSLFRSFAAKGISLHGSRSGFEPESPVHFRTWT